MKASKFSDAQKAFILKHGADGMPVADICRTGDLLHLEEAIRWVIANAGGSLIYASGSIFRSGRVRCSRRGRFILFVPKAVARRGAAKRERPPTGGLSVLHQPQCTRP